ncbi:MAG TPA: hypothetical protein VK464_20100 [Symbiobacteriaceae bacterium]|jgi:hypothetical protein|nr:hypothetical protein [Symbiobacteriaceae bacterium]
MPDMPVRVWSSQRPQALEAGFMAVSVIVLWIGTTIAGPWPSLSALLALLIGLRWLMGRRSLPLVALTDGLLVAIGWDQSVTHVSLAAAELDVTPNGCSLRWRDGNQRPALSLPGFAGQQELVEALRAAQLDMAPLRSNALARLFPIVRIRPFWDWSTAAIVIGILALVAVVRWFDLSVLWLLPLTAVVWLDARRPASPWAMLTPDGLWLLMPGAEPVLLARDQITGITTDQWEQTTVIQTTHPDFAALPVPTAKGKVLLGALRQP